MKHLLATAALLAITSPAMAQTTCQGTVSIENANNAQWVYINPFDAKLNPCRAKMDSPLGRRVMANCETGKACHLTYGADDIWTVKPMTGPEVGAVVQAAAEEKRQIEKAHAAEQAKLATQLAALPKSLEITFVQGVQSGGTYTGIVAMRNTTGINFGTVTWACEFREGGYKTGGGYAVFHLVPNNAIAIDSLSFYQNGTAQFTTKCELAGTEKLSPENERLHSLGRQRANLPASSPTRFWVEGYNNGSAVVTDASKVR